MHGLLQRGKGWSEGQVRDPAADARASCAQLEHLGKRRQHAEAVGPPIARANVEVVAEVEQHVQQLRKPPAREQAAHGAEEALDGSLHRRRVRLEHRPRVCGPESRTQAGHADHLDKVALSLGEEAAHIRVARLGQGGHRRRLVVGGDALLQGDYGFGHGGMAVELENGSLEHGRGRA